MKENRQLRPDKLFTKRKHYNYKKIYYGASESIKDKEQLRKEIDAATVEYLKNNEITHLPDSPNIKGYSVKVKDLREISDTEEFYYLEEQNENNLY
jgi:hypothetical protein